MYQTTYSPTELVHQLEQLVSLPAVYFEVKRLIDDPDSTVDDLSEVIMLDPALTARLLRLANSAFFGMSSRFDTVDRAVNFLGYSQVHDLVLATSVASAFDDIPQEHLDMRRFWNRSVYAAMSSRQLAMRCHVLDRDRVFVEGMLHDIGHLVMYNTIPSLAGIASATAERTGEPLFQVENTLIGCDYADVGAMLAKLWQLPESLIEVIRCHPKPIGSNDMALDSAIVHIGALLGEAYVTAPREANWELPVDPFAWRVTNLKASDLQSVRRDTDAVFADILGVFFPEYRPMLGSIA